jgi:hypothetical protein
MTRPREFMRWAGEIFGPISLDPHERVTRFLEEALEVAHAAGVQPVLLDKIIDRVWQKAPNPSDLPKEIGQAQACLEMFSESIGLSADEEANREFDRVRIIPKDEWTRRHQAKVALGIASAILLAIVMQTEVHAGELVPPEWPGNPAICTLTGHILTCKPADRQKLTPNCAPGYEQACQQRDHGTDGLRRSEQKQ